MPSPEQPVVHARTCPACGTEVGTTTPYFVCANCNRSWLMVIDKGGCGRTSYVEVLPDVKSQECSNCVHHLRVKWGPLLAKYPDVAVSAPHAAHTVDPALAARRKRIAESAGGTPESAARIQAHREAAAARPVARVDDEHALFGWKGSTTLGAKAIAGTAAGRGKGRLVFDQAGMHFTLIRTVHTEPWDNIAELRVTPASRRKRALLYIDVYEGTDSGYEVRRHGPDVLRGRLAPLMAKVDEAGEE